ncbi:MAG: hypothetical protein JW909_02280 [Planctomycetes bacterium]|nr:hypothetical protein [Planctomycetota bacterium]
MRIDGFPMPQSRVLRNIAENCRQMAGRRFVERMYEFRAERAAALQKARRSGVVISESPAGTGALLDVTG